MSEKGKIHQMVEENLKQSELLQCTRVWESWGYKTMTEDDFVEFDTSEILQEIEKLEPVWIPVWEKYPSKYSEVLILTKAGGINVGYLRGEYDYEVCGTDFSDTVTHWQHLPLPPN